MNGIGPIRGIANGRNRFAIIPKHDILDDEGKSVLIPLAMALSNNHHEGVILMFIDPFPGPSRVFVVLLVLEVHGQTVLSAFHRLQQREEPLDGDDAFVLSRRKSSEVSKGVFTLFASACMGCG